MATKKSAAKTPAAKTAMPKMTPTSATKKTTSASSKTTAATAYSGAPVRLLSGGNPQITKGYGAAPVQAYIAALSGWKSDVVAKLDALIEKTVPGVHKAVKWNTPFYGVDEGIWFIGVHVLKGSVQLTFFRGASLEPVPDRPSKVRDTRYHHIREDDGFDEPLLSGWLKQAAVLPGEKL